MTDPLQPDPTSAAPPPSDWARPATDPTAPSPAAPYPPSDPAQAYAAGADTGYDPAAQAYPAPHHAADQGYGQQHSPGYHPGYHQGYGQYPPAPYGGYGAGWAAPRRTNGLAIGSMVTSISALVLMACTKGIAGVVGIVGVVLGHVARRQIRERGEAGNGFALAGIIVGWIAVGLAVIAILLVVLFLVVRLPGGSEAYTT